ncbi:hypothetical protein DSCOOX_29940 [Desulfosarcina ovata subsp. ovata]|uniref:Uncharacterized protein n=1 Tax=Desulfosarcina ovata subsp. ovata TaxID=2752305 RepID=A0A5K8ACT7_9BACT|nr:hypothetical protein DSCOOX_29940 [Desulfosarcina ovata subsp. ovata]
MIQIEIGIAIEIEKKMGRRHADWMSIDLRSMVIGAMGNRKTRNRIAPFCQPVIPKYIVDFDPDFDFDFDFDFDKPELHAIAWKTH